MRRFLVKMLRGTRCSCKTMLLCGSQGVVESNLTSLTAAKKSERTKALSISLRAPDVHVKGAPFGHTMVPLMISCHLEAAGSWRVISQSARITYGRPSDKKGAPTASETYLDFHPSDRVQESSTMKTTRPWRHDIEEQCTPSHDQTPLGHKFW